MGRFTRYRGLPDQAYDPRVTDMDAAPFNVPAATGPQAIQPGDVVTGVDASGAPIYKRAGQWVNRNIANTFPYLVPGSASGQAQLIRALPANPKRTGILINNKDTVNTLNFGFGNSVDTNSPGIGPGATVLLDFTTPASELYLFNANVANINVSVIEMTRV